MKLRATQYDNKEVINFLKQSLILLEKSESSWTYTGFDEYNYTISIVEGKFIIKTFAKNWGKVKNYICVDRAFEKRSETIKAILKDLKII